MIRAERELYPQNGSTSANQTAIVAKYLDVHLTKAKSKEQSGSQASFSKMVKMGCRRTRTIFELRAGISLPYISCFQN